jgi:ubiquinone/menaquinone biosynthesis C-methylase UbiE
LARSAAEDVRPEDASSRDPKRDNAVYHDAAAATYDGKWSLSFEDFGRGYVQARAERMLPRPRYGRALEVGAGTGFWILNLWQNGYVEEAHATDISEGMLEVCRQNAEHLGCDIDLRSADAEELPYPDETFDLVTGHAFLHHLPEPGAGLAEMFRVLRPGGALFLAGEPTRVGDRLAGLSKRAAVRGFRALERVPALRDIRRRPSEDPATEEERVLRDLEFAVDLHTFEPRDVAGWALEVGFRDGRVETEELLASLFGWAVRTIEGEARPGLLGRRWAIMAMYGWVWLYRFDQAALYRLLPKRLFYNLLLYAEKPGRP